MVEWIRARRDDQIEQRVDEIVAATARLFELHRFEEISFALIAREASFTRSNLYRYFETREDIFLALLQHDMVLWRDAVMGRLANFKGSNRKLAEAWMALLLEHRRMIQLFAILYTLLEPNASLAALTDFKRQIVDIQMGLAGFLAQTVGFRSPEAASEFLLAQTFLLIGACPLMALTPKQLQAMSAAGMSTDLGNTQVTLAHSLELLISGARHQPD